MPNEKRVKIRPETPATSETTSTDRLPDGPWGKTWLVVMVVVAIGLFAYETAVRYAGHVPTLTDDRALWAMQRERIDTSSNSSGGDEESARPAIVLLGASRMQVGIDPEILENLSGRRVVNLAINGHDPMATLRDLAENARQFQGLAIVDIVPSAMRREQWNAQQPWVKFYWQQWGPNERLNREIRTAVQANFAFANPASALQRALPALAQGQPPRRFHIHTRHDRFQAADFSIATHLNDRRDRFERALDAVDPNAWRAAHSAMMADFREVARLTRALESRGANVVFVHFASSGPLRELEECQFPRAECWDRFVEIITTSTRAEAFHADDVPALAAIDTPDWSHVDYRDVPAHTRALYDELVRRGVLPSAGRSAAAERVGSGASSAISGTERQR